MAVEKWYGSAGICINNDKKILMVKQGRPEERKKWSVPSGEREVGESYEACCIREIKEETGLDVQIRKPLFTKHDQFDNRIVHVEYYQVVVIGGQEEILDPDHLIYEVAWKSASDIKQLELTYPRDREILLEFIYHSEKISRKAY